MTIIDKRGRTWEADPLGGEADHEAVAMALSTSEADEVRVRIQAHPTMVEGVRLEGEIPVVFRRVYFLPNGEL